MPKDSQKANLQFTFHKPSQPTGHSSNAGTTLTNQMYSQMLASTGGDLVVRNSHINIPLRTPQASQVLPPEMAESGQPQYIEGHPGPVESSSAVSETETEPLVNPAYLEHIKLLHHPKKRVCEAGVWISYLCLQISTVFNTTNFRMSHCMTLYQLSTPTLQRW